MFGGSRHRQVCKLRASGHRANSAFTSTPETFCFPYCFSRSSHPFGTCQLVPEWQSGDSSLHCSLWFFSARDPPDSLGGSLQSHTAINYASHHNILQVNKTCGQKLCPFCLVLSGLASSLKDVPLSDILAVSSGYQPLWCHGLPSPDSLSDSV